MDDYGQQGRPTGGRSGSNARRWSVGGAIALASLLTALSAWLVPNPFGWGGAESTRTGGNASLAPSDGRNSGPATPNPTITPGPSVPGGAAATRHVDSLTPTTGMANLTTLPRGLTGRPGYDRPVVLRCPSNDSDDKIRDVLYPLDRRYTDLVAVLRPYHPDPEAADGTTWVTVVPQVRQRDGTFANKDEGTRVIASGTEPADVNVDLVGADRLSVKVQCQYPDGFAVLADARLIREL